MDPAERALLAETVRQAIERGATASDGPRGLDGVVADLGWLEMLDTEPRVAVEIVFGALGATGGTASVLDDVIASALGMEPRPDLAVALPEFGSSRPPGTLEGGRLTARGIASARVITADELVIVCRDGDGVSTATLPMGAVEATPVQGIDPLAGLHLVRVESDPTATPLDRASWESAVGRGRRAVAHQIAGACRTMLDLARTHALERTQFDRPIARFQAVRHRLAEALVAIEALDATLTAAADEDGAVTAALAKAVAGQTARTVGTHCQQVLAGIGFTTDHPFHRFLKRTMTLDGILGSADEIEVELGRELLATRRVPTLIEL